MKQQQPVTNLEKKSRAEQRDISAAEVARLLSRVASLFELQPDNIGMSSALRSLSGALSSHGNKPVESVIGILRDTGLLITDDDPQTQAALGLPINLSDISLDEVEAVLANSSYTKDQFVELGFTRFGVSRSRLTRTGREKMIEIIRSAVDHEKSLAAIDREAARGGAINLGHWMR